MDMYFSLAPIFSDGAVLQRQMPVLIFGEGPENAEVTVTLGDDTARGIVHKGVWQAALPPAEAGLGLELTAVCRGQRITVKDIAVGEVWIAGGQSNMEFQIDKEAERDTVIPAADDPLLRFFDMPRISYDGEEKDISFAEFGKWRPFLPEHAGWFSAVGAYFGMELRDKLNVPVGIVGCNYGGTSASCWLSEPYLDAVPALAAYRDTYEAAVRDLDKERYMALFRERQRMGQTPGMREFFLKLARGELALEDVKKKLAELTPHQWELLQIPCGPMAATRPFALYHNMVERLAPYGARGVIWYQGEADEVLPEQYAALFGQMVRCWRDAWGRELPFLTVQLAPFGSWLSSTGEAFPELRRQQETAARTIPGVWMASIMDSGMETDIHPKKKRVVGERLSLLARGRIYDEKDLICEPPEYVRGRWEDQTLCLQFDNAGAELRCKGEVPQGLEVFADGVKTDCMITLTGSEMRISAAALGNAAAVQVRYAQMPYVEADLYSSAGLCAKPFTAWFARGE